MKSLLSTLYRILWGKPYYRFCTVLLAAGVNLLAGPEWWELLAYFAYWVLSLLAEPPSSLPTFQLNLWVQGFGGILCCVSIWLFVHFYNTDPDRNAATPHESEGKLSITIEDGWTFKATANAIAELEKKLIRFDGFSNDELATKLKPREVEFESAETALRNLANLFVKPMARPYTVSIEDGTLVLKKEDE